MLDQLLKSASLRPDDLLRSEVDNFCNSNTFDLVTYDLETGNVTNIILSNVSAFRVGDTFLRHSIPDYDVCLEVRTHSGRRLIQKVFSDEHGEVLQKAAN